MKTTRIISMAEFLTEVGKLAKQVNQEYYLAKCEIRQTSSGNIHYEFTCYIHTKTHVSGKTPNEALQLMKDLISAPKPSTIKDVILEDDKLIDLPF